MAAVVSHGYMARCSDQMHPFFRNADAGKPLAANHTRFSTDATSSAMNLHPSSEHAGSLNTTQSNLQMMPDVKNPVKASNTDTDPNLDRRKRRKITPSGQDDDSNTFIDTEPPTEAWRQQLEDAADWSEAPSVDYASSVTSPDKSIEHISKPSPSRPARIPESEDSPSRGESLLRGEPVLGSGEHGLNQLDGHQSPSRKTTQKKMLQLTRKGKLINSPPKPRKSSRRSERSSTTATGNKAQHERSTVSRKIVISYEGGQREAKDTSEKIDKILAGQIRVPLPAFVPQPRKAIPKDDLEPKRPTHPFFIGKAAMRVQQAPESSTTDGRSTREPSTEPSTVQTKQPVPWNEIKFSTRKVSANKDVGTLRSIWPPLALQHLRPEDVKVNGLLHRHVAEDRAKRKQEVVTITEDENIFTSYKHGLAVQTGPKSRIRLPERLDMDARDLINKIDEGRQSHSLSSEVVHSLQRIREAALVNRCAFEQGKAAGPQDWTHTYSPKRQDEVLQPTCKSLLEWLSKFNVTQVQSTLSTKSEAVHAKRTRRKRRLKRDELSDFITESDDEEVEEKIFRKNVIVLVGPSGSGKTASVFAVAHELDYEIFEVHPGMRRTAKDIFDKVGDMSLNHLVQPSTAVTRESSTITDCTGQETTGEELSAGKQSTISNFLNGASKHSHRPATPQSEKLKSQKQSLILFEEVDVLFDDDKTFWSGVQTLAQQSKRPIILTCNNLESVPLDELEIHATLHFDRPSVADAVEYLAYLAAAEGHLIDRTGLTTLFLSRGQDLRASITELNFWCQMTVGSELGGLDWMRHGSSRSKESRIISKDTFRSGLNLLPEADLSAEDLLILAEDSLGLSVLDWEDTGHNLVLSSEGRNCLDDLHDLWHLSEVKSCMDMMALPTASLLSTSASSAYPHIRRHPKPADIAAALLSRPKETQMSSQELMAVFEPIMEDYRTFPPTTGRAAASLDGGCHTVATDIAPFVRYIVAFDERLEEQRNELAGGSQGILQRKTRAARAALEGGDKASTRRERWFPKDLNFEQVRNTLPCSQLYDDGPDPSTQTEGSVSSQPV